MPLYVYKCSGCGHEFEELVSRDKLHDNQPCKLCGSDSERKAATTFGIHSSIDPRKDTVFTPKEIDKVVGSKAEQKWAGYNERWRKRYESRQKARRGGKELTPISMPKDSDGKYRPLMHLGNKKDRAVRKEFVEALQKHRAERKKKGISQFDGPGPIDESPPKQAGQ